MKFILKTTLMSIAVLFVISSCATITEGPEGTSLLLGRKEPPRGGEVKLLSMEVPQSGNLSANVEYWATINFEADPKPEISRACFNFSGEGPSCVDVKAKDMTYGVRANFRVAIRIPMGTKKIDCYAEYIQDGKTLRTNTVTYYIIVLKKPEE